MAYLFYTLFMNRCDMKFVSQNGKTFNSIEMYLLKRKMPVGSKQYAVCVKVRGELYCVYSKDNLEDCRLTAKQFLRKFETPVLGYLLFKQDADNLTILELFNYNIVPQCTHKEDISIIKNDEDDFFKIQYNKYLNTLGTN